MPARRTKYFTLWMQEIPRSGSDLRKAAMEEGNADREAHGYKPLHEPGKAAGNTKPIHRSGRTAPRIPETRSFLDGDAAHLQAV